MLKIYRHSIYLAIVIFTSQAYAQSPTVKSAGEHTTVYVQCLEKAQGDSDMQACLDAELTVQDSRLNSAYKKLMSQLPAEMAQELKQAQRSWIEFKKHDCQLNFMILGGGTASKTAQLDCENRITTLRAQNLEDYLETTNLFYGK